MDGEQTRLDRETLYERVWSMPMSRLSPEYGLSDVGLAKICKRLNVPRPGLGHWTKVKHGKREKRPALPPSPVSGVWITKRARRPAGSLRRSSTLSIKVPALPEELHPLVKRTMRAFQRAKPDHRGILQSRRKGLLAIYVSPETKDRAIRLADALLRGIESRGHCVSISDKDKPTTSVDVNGEFVSISIQETVNRSNHILTEKELADEEKRGWSYAPRFDFVPSGKLSLRILELERTGLCQKWSDGKKQRLEDCLGQFVAALETAAAHQRGARLEAEDRARRWREERIREEVRRRRREYKEELIAVLKQQAADWKQAGELRSFLDAVERAFPNSDCDSTFATWLDWGRAVAERLNPMVDPSSIPRPMDPA